MRTLKQTAALHFKLADQQGMTLVELLVATAMSLLIVVAAIALVQITQSNVTRVDAQVSQDQRARIALENLMLELHSGCVLPKYQPIQAGANEVVLDFISGTGEGPVPESVRYHEIKVENVKVQGNHTVLGLVEYSRSGSIGNGTVTIANEPPARRVLVTGVTHLTREGTTVPYFRYYRYYELGDEGYVAGQLDPAPLPVPLTAESAQKVSKVTVAFGLAPEFREGIKPNLEPTTFEDSAVYRITPSSTVATPAPAPCE